MTPVTNFTLSRAHGGTGGTTRNAAMNNVLPDPTTHNGELMYCVNNNWGSSTPTEIGLVTSVAATAPLTNSGTATSPNFSISAATTSAAGSMSAADKTKLNAYPAYAARSFNNSPGRSIVTVAGAANGFQIDSARDAQVTYSVTVTGSSTLSGGASGYVALEVCPTNSATAANWVEISRGGGGQTNGLIVGLALTTVNTQSVTGMVPGGYYARLRSVNSAGTPTYVINSSQEVKL